MEIHRDGGIRQCCKVLALILFSTLNVLPLHFFLLTTHNHAAAPKVKRSALLPLRFRHDGTFKILQVADMHYGMGKISRCLDVLPSEFDRCSDINTTSFLRKMIQTEMPDLVVFTGDNIYGTSTTDAAESLFSAFAPVIELKIPWAAILGNHDQESTMNREELMSLMSLMDYSISQVNPYSEVPRKLVEIDGFGNYNIKVHGPFGSDMVNMSIFNLYLLDSGDQATVDGRRTYGWIKKSQLLWLSETAKQLQATYASPALAFFHIPIQEVRGLWYKKITGQFQEAIACSFVNTGVLDSLVAMRDVKAVFMGHDHLNDFCGDIDGIWFCFGGGFGYHGYGSSSCRTHRSPIPDHNGFQETFLSGLNSISKSYTAKSLSKPTLLSSETALFPRFLHQDLTGSSSAASAAITMPVGEKLMDKIRVLRGERLQLGSISPPPHSMTQEEVRKVLKMSKMEKVKMRLRAVKAISISYSQFVQICCSVDGDVDGTAIAKDLDQSGAVLVIGDVVFLNPELGKIEAVFLI